MNQEQLRTAAFDCGGKPYTEGQMRAVVGVSLSFAQLAKFASAIAADERGTFAQTAAEMNRVSVAFAVEVETQRCIRVVQALAEGDPIPVMRAIQEGKP